MINFKKITIITSEFPPEPGGIGNHAYNPHGNGLASTSVLVGANRSSSK